MTILECRDCNGEIPKGKAGFLMRGIPHNWIICEECAKTSPFYLEILFDAWDYAKACDIPQFKVFEKEEGTEL